MERDLTKRLGCGPNAQQRLREHPWFRDVDWDVMARKEGKPPFVPDPAKVNFDATYELEEMLLEDKPLKAKPRTRRDTGKVRENEAQLQEIETKFEPFSSISMKRTSRFFCFVCSCFQVQFVDIHSDANSAHTTFGFRDDRGVAGRFRRSRARRRGRRLC